MLQLRDIDMLRNVRSILNSDHFISVGWNDSGTCIRRPFGCISVSDTHFASALYDMGCVPNKCDKIRMPFDIVPEDGTHILASSGKCTIAFASTSDVFIKELHEFVCSSLDVNCVALQSCSKNRVKKPWRMEWEQIKMLQRLQTLFTKIVTYQWF